MKPSKLQLISNIILKKSTSILCMAALMVLSLFPSAETNATYYAEATVAGNQFSAKCWAQPTAPTLVSLPNNTVINDDGDAWLSNSVMDWDPSSSSCPTANLEYQFQVATNPDFTGGSIVQTSAWISNTDFVTSANAEGLYYWRVFVRDGAHLSIASNVSGTFHYTIDFAERGGEEVDVLKVDPEQTEKTSQSQSDTQESNSFTQTVVLNEFLADPVGDDNAALPGGEWVELFNRTDQAIDINGWAIYADQANAAPLIVSSSNTFTGFVTDTATTIIPAQGYLVVYRAGNPDFDLKNIPEGGPSDAETIRLFNGLASAGAQKQDEYTYTKSTEDRTDTRNPAGFGAWADPIPSPGGPAIMDISQLPAPVAKTSQEDKEHLILGIGNGLKYKKAQVNVTYTRDQDGSEVQEALSKEFDITSNVSYLPNIFLGTESSGTPNPHKGIKDVQIEVTLTGEGEVSTILHSSIVNWSSK